MAPLERFLSAQAIDYDTALSELRRGRKESHWIWYVLPQLRGLGLSERALFYGIEDLQEARDYLGHPVLGARLRTCIEAICVHAGSSAVQILGDVDAIKFRSCLTLFAAAAPGDALFTRALAQFYQGKPDPRTVALLSNPTRADTAS